MKTIAEMIAARDAALASATAIQTAAQEEGRDMTTEEVAQVNEFATKAETLNGEIKAAQKSQQDAIDAAARLDAINEDLAKALPKRTVAANTKAQSAIVTADEIDKDPNRGFKDHRSFLLAVMEASQAQAGGHSMEAVYAVHPGLEYLAVVGADEQSTFSDPHGGFLVPEGFSPNLLTVPSESDPMAGRTTNVPMASPVVKIPARVDKNHTSSVSGGLRVYRRAEADTSASSRMEMELVELAAHGLFGIAYVTEELMQDSPISFAAILDQGFRDEFSSVLIDERLNGTGVGQYLGINNCPCLVTVTKESGQAADTLVGANLIKMRARCWGYGNAVWIANHDTMAQLVGTHIAGTNGDQAIFVPSSREDVPDMLWGRPIIFSEYAETLGDAGDIVLGNWTQYLEGTLMPLEGAESIHVRFINAERTFRFWTRNAGAPWWRTALTPKKGADTLSPFVRLAARA